jgi:hypothetical protein
MIEAVNTLSVQAVASKATSSPAVSFKSASRESVAPSMGGLKIRIDVKLDRAILEYRSGEGELIRQYPTESQIKAIQRFSEARDKSAAKEKTSESTAAVREQKSESAYVAELEVTDISDANVKPESNPSSDANSSQIPSIIV